MSGILSHGIDFSRQNSAGYPPLHFAAAEEYALGVSLLLSAGAPVDARDKEGTRPLEIAVEKRNITIIGLLLEAGAHADAQVNSLALANRDLDLKIIALLGLDEGVRSSASRSELQNEPVTKTVYIRERPSDADYNRMKQEILSELSAAIAREPEREQAVILKLRELVREESEKQ